MASHVRLLWLSTAHFDGVTAQARRSSPDPRPGVEKPAQLEKVMVTANRRKNVCRDVPVSVTRPYLLT